MYQYKLASNRVPKLDCPYCGSKKHWQRYVDIRTGEILPEEFGRCDNANKCSAWNDPYITGYDTTGENQDKSIRNRKRHQSKKITPKPTFIPANILKETLKQELYEQNVFLQNLHTCMPYPFEIEDVEKVTSFYYLGTVSKGYRAGATTFPFIDAKGNVRAIQVKQFDDTNHTIGTDFLHSIIEKNYKRILKPLPEWLKTYHKNQTKVSCLFGEHLLNKYPHNPIALVEAPKTAIYGTLYFGFPEQPKDFLWLAVYNLNSLNLTKCKILEGRNVYLFPDLSKDGNAFKLWSDKADQIQKSLKSTYFRISDLLEQLAPEQDRVKGNDLADYLIRHDWRLFRRQKEREIIKSESLSEDTNEFTYLTKLNIEWLTNANIQNCKNLQDSEWWNKQILELESYYLSSEIPRHSIKLDQSCTIKDVSLFVSSHLTYLKANNGKDTFLPYLNRLHELKSILERQVP